MACGYGLAGLWVWFGPSGDHKSKACSNFCGILLMLLACTRRCHSRHAKPYPKVILERRKHLSGSLVECGLGHRLLSFLLLMLLACTRRRHSRHAKPYPKVILERRKHLFGSLGKCELHSGPPIALLPTAYASCLHPQAPQSACQTIPKSNFGASKTPFRITRRV